MSITYVDKIYKNKKMYTYIVQQLEEDLQALHNLFPE